MPAEDLQQLPPVAAEWTAADTGPPGLGVVINIPLHAEMEAKVFNHDMAAQTQISAQITIGGISLEDLFGLGEAIRSEADRLSRGG